MKRYVIVARPWDSYSADWDAREFTTGEWVRYEDHAADRAALVAQLEEYRKQALSEAGHAIAAEDSCDKLRKEVELAKRAAATYASAADRLQSQVSELTRERDEAREERDFFDRERQNAVESLSATEAKVTRLTEALAAERRAANLAAQRQVAAEARVLELDAHRQRLALEAGELRKERGEHLIEIASLKRELAETTDDALKQRVEYWRESSQAAESRLAAANALLTIWVHGWARGRVGRGQLMRDTRAHLAAQPATALQRSIDAAERDVPAWRRDAAAADFPVYAVSTAPDYDPITAPVPAGDMNGPHGELPQPATPTRTEAEPTCPCGWCVLRAESEQRVLDACGSVPKRVLEDWCGHVSDWPRRIAKAELARREASRG